jgi:hypothetical protein
MFTFFYSKIALQRKFSSFLSFSRRRESSFFLYGHDESAFPLDCPTSPFAMCFNIVAGQ